MFYCKSRMTNAAAHPLWGGGGAERERERAAEERRRYAWAGRGSRKLWENAKGPGEGAVIGLGGWCEAR